MHVTFIPGYPVKLKDYTCMAGQDLLCDSNRDFVMTVGPRCINLIAEQKLVLSWLLENIKSYESRPLEQNPTQKLLSIDTGRLVYDKQVTYLIQTPLSNTDTSLLYGHFSLKYSYFSSTDIFLSITDISLVQPTL